MNPWVYWAIGALLFQAAKIYWQNWSARRLSSYQHQQLISSLFTVVLCVLYILFTFEPVGRLGIVAMLAGLAGIGYALGSMMSTAAQRHIPMSTFHSLMRLSVFIPVPVFYFLLGERPTVTQWTGVFSTLVPLLMIALFATEAETHQGRTRMWPESCGKALA